MRTIQSINEYQQLVEHAETFLLFIKTDNCSVCEGLRPQVEEFEKDYSVPFYLANAAKMPELAGELLLFSAPVVLLFHKGRESQRFVRFVRIEELRNRLDELEESSDV
ncbi:thioredoxin family protein [Planococcus beigongshangi]|uniref:thioredoxin family protein n=1 Tax=Planococcus beigongshangi TaxID=2782536 RepID=UPI00193B7206|nr:thioredoxin family protein [Planococcus beigongshangi]